MHCQPGDLMLMPLKNLKCKSGMIHFLSLVAILNIIKKKKKLTTAM